MTKARKNPLRVDFNLHSDFKVIWVVQSLAQKHFAGFVGQISSPVHAISSPGGADRDRHERGMGCGGRDSVGAQSVRRAVSVSEQWRARRTALFPPSPGFRRKGTRPGEASWRSVGSRTAKPCGPDARCWRQVRGGKSAQPGLDEPSIR
jgi:hypothetical protein